MKKQLLLTIAVAIATVSYSQQQFTGGVRAGASYSGLRGDAMNNLQDILDYTGGMITKNDRIGMFAGGYVNVPISEIFSVEPALYYAQKGYQLKGSLDVRALDFLGVNAKANLKTHYIDLPVVMKANFGGFEVFAGPQLSYLVKADLKTTAGALGFNVLDKTFDMTDQLNKWDAGVTGGIGYSFGKGMNIRASYDHGLSKADANKRFETYNKSFKLGIGIGF